MTTDHPMTAAECRELASEYKAQARQAGISQRRATLLVNISHSFSGLASQLDILADDMKAEKP
jgi:hypothetical protein